jgi:hypothetical protein
MAVSTNRALIKLRGQIGKLLVIRYYAQADRIVVSAFPKMDKVIFSKSQLHNQSKFKKAVEFASNVRSSEMLCFMFKQALGNEISVYKEAVKQYFKNPDSPLNFLLQVKMQGSSKDEPKMTLPLYPNKPCELPEKYIHDNLNLEKISRRVQPIFSNNPNHRKSSVPIPGKLA